MSECFQFLTVERFCRIICTYIIKDLFEFFKIICFNEITSSLTNIIFAITDFY